MDRARRITLGLSIAATGFILGAAILTGNGAVYMLGSLAAISTLVTWRGVRPE